MKVCVVIPVRMEASRFPGKPLAPILGKPMVQWVYERSCRSRADGVYVATDSQEIAAAVRAFDGGVVMTGRHHPNGTSRIAEAAADLDCDVVINVQGDEPGLHPEAIDTLILAMSEDPEEMATLAERMTDPGPLFDPNVVKVAVASSGRALYFSRAPIPYRKHDGMHSPMFPPATGKGYWRHIGVYAFRKPFLLRYAASPACALEETEGLEQLRALDMGANIRVLPWNQPTVGVDTPADIAKAEAYLREQGSI